MNPSDEEIKIMLGEFPGIECDEFADNSNSVNKLYIFNEENNILTVLLKRSDLLSNDGSTTRNICSGDNIESDGSEWCLYTQSISPGTVIDFQINIPALNAVTTTFAENNVSTLGLFSTLINDLGYLAEMTFVLIADGPYKSSGGSYYLEGDQVEEGEEIPGLIDPVYDSYRVQYNNCVIISNNNIECDIDGVGIIQPFGSLYTQ